MSIDGKNRTQARIDEQQAIVAGLVPGSEPHRIATQILLLMQDSLAINYQIDELIAAARRLQQGIER